MKKIKEIISYIWSVLNKNTPEGIFIVLLLFAMVRLAFMQLPIFKHENYKVLYDIYVENDKINVTAGEILDRNGRSLARQAKVAEMTIKSFKKQKEEDNSGMLYYDLPILDSGEQCAESYEKVFNKHILSYTYNKPCYIRQYNIINRAEIFNKTFLENISPWDKKKNKDIIESECQKNKNDEIKCKNVPFERYVLYQKELEAILSVQNINGFRQVLNHPGSELATEDHSYKKGLNEIMSGVCSSLLVNLPAGGEEMPVPDNEKKERQTSRDQKESIIHDMNLLKLSNYSEVQKYWWELIKKDQLTDFEEKELKFLNEIFKEKFKFFTKEKTTLYDYCAGGRTGDLNDDHKVYKEPNTFKLYIKPSDIFKNNNFTYSAFSELQKNGLIYLSDVTTKHSVLGNKYCSNAKKPMSKEQFRKEKEKERFNKLFGYSEERLEVDYGEYIAMYSPKIMSEQNFAEHCSKYGGKNCTNPKKYAKYLKKYNANARERERMHNCIAFYNFNIDKIKKDFFDKNSKYISFQKDPVNLLENKKVLWGNIELSTSPVASKEEVDLAEIELETYYSIMPEIGETEVYYTDGIRYNLNDKLINMLDTAMLPPSDKPNKASVADKSMKSVLDTSFVKALNLIPSDRTEDREKLKKEWIKWPYRKKPNQADYMLAPLLGLNFSSWNIMDIMTNKILQEAQNRIEADKIAKNTLQITQENVDRQEILVHEKKTDKLLHYAVRDVNKKGEDGHIVRNTDGTIEKIPGVSTTSWRGIAGKYYSKLKKGLNITLTIDAATQAKAEWLIRDKCEQLKADRGIILVQDVSNGDMLAMAEYTSPYSKYAYADIPDIVGKNKDGSICKKDDGSICRKDESQYKSYLQWNTGSNMNAIYSPYKPGSTFKPFVVAAALDTGIVTPAFKITNLQKTYNALIENSNADNKIISEAWKRIREHGDKDPKKESFNLKKIIAESSNVGASYIAYLMLQEDMKPDHSDFVLKTMPKEAGKYSLLEKMKAFGFGTPTGIGEEVGLPEKEGNLFYLENDPIKNASILDYLKIGYGQGVMEVTPIQLITAYSALVNGGTRYRPRVIKNTGGGDKEETEIVIARPNVISKETSKNVRKYMRAVITDEKGTGTGAKDSKAAIEGKTGTADIILDKYPKGYPIHSKEVKEKAHLSSFAAFVPYTNDNNSIDNQDSKPNPGIMILIMVDENAKMAGKGEKYRPMGSEFAKTAKELADYLCDNYHYPNARCQSSQGQNQRNTAVNNHRR